MKKYHDIAIALSGVCQSAMLVPQFSSSGQCNYHSYDIALKSLFNMNPSSTIDVFDDIENLKIGLNFLTKMFHKNQKEKMETMRYVICSLTLASKLLKDNSALEEISQRLNRVKLLHGDLNLDVISEHRDELSYSLAGIYSDIISPITSKIKVTGKIGYLQNSLVQAKIRTALFASVRAAVLWYQVGGNRLQILFSRKKLSNTATEILKRIPD